MTLFIVGVITAMFCLVSGVALGVGIAQTLDDKMFKKHLDNYRESLIKAKMSLDAAQEQFITETFRDYKKRLDTLGDSLVEAYNQGREDMEAEKE